VCFEDLDVTAPAWPVAPATFDVVLMSYVSGSVPESALRDVYRRAHAALKPGGVAIVHDFMVDDSLDGPRGAALWALQHVAVNADGLGLHPAAVAAKLEGAGFSAVDAPREMIGGMTKLVIAHKA
jgi:predicted methyltransferase